MEGQTLSHYRVLERLGGGGMGVVYKALDMRLDRHVALKFLPAELTRDDEARLRFIHEAKAASALDHPNICTIHEIDVTPQDQQFIAMAYYEGETLSKRLQRGPLPLDQAVDVAIQIALGLVEAHAAGIVHRDIKPANVMLTKNGQVKIVDFGIAKLSGIIGQTRTGNTLGTVSYMSPEQIAGQPADQQSDVWSLGAVFYEMLTGQQPFRGEHQWAVMSAINEHEPERPSAIRAEIPADVERLVLKALQKDRTLRHKSATEFVNEAKTAHAALTKLVEIPPATTAAWRPRLTGRPALAALVGIAIVAGSALWWWNRSAGPRWARNEAVPEILRLIEQDRYGAAFRLAEQAEHYIANDPVLADLWRQISATQSFVTKPPGVEVFVQAL